MNKILPFLLFSPFLKLAAQEPMEVVRCSAVDYYSPVQNVFVDANNEKWVGNRKGLFQVHSPEQSSPAELGPAEWSLLQTRDGNHDLKYPLADLLAQMGSQGENIRSQKDRITAAIFDERRSELWVGTAASGLFQFKTNPTLKLAQRHHSGNSKLASNRINTLFLDATGKLWIGTGEGAVFGKDGKWDIQEKLFNIQSFAQSGSDIWVMGDELLWKVNAQNRWYPVDIDAGLTEGVLVDIAADANGNLWLASEIIARYQPETEEFKIFGPADAFTSQDVANITVDFENAAWIGTNDKGLYVIQKASTFNVACLVDKALTCGTGKNDAALKVLVSGGQPPYTFLWSSGLAGETPRNLGPGEYSLTVTDSKGKSKTAKAVIENPNPSLTLAQDKQASADGAADGSATATVQGGKPGYQFKWDNGETARTASKLNEGTHTLTVTDQAGCTVAGSVAISRQIGALAVSISQTAKINCPNENTAALKAAVTGGKAPYQFQWSQVMGGETVSGLKAGSYILTVTDASGQSSTAQFLVKEPQPIAATAKADAPASTGNADGKATAKATGGTGSFSFKWDNGETAASAARLAPGNHTVTLADEAGCTATASVSITENILPLAASISQTQKINCAGEKSAALAAEVSGGKGPFKYNWDSGGQAETATALPAGNHTVTVTDAAGQTFAAQFSVKEPQPIAATAKADAPASTGNSDGKATAKASGGTGGFSFKWDNGETAAAAARLAPGSHSVTLADEAGCTATASVSITENILPLAVSISQTQKINCAGEKSAALAAEVSGGKGPFKYNWDSGGQGETATTLPAGNYNLTVTDATGQTSSAQFLVKEPQPIAASAKADAPASTGNSDGKATAKASGGTGGFSFKWDNGETAATAARLAPGSHSVTLADEAGCTATASVSITENILPLTVGISQTQKINCAGEKSAALAAEVSGGKGPFKYNWDSGGQAETATALPAGNFALTVTDVTGQSATSTVAVTEPLPLLASISKKRPTVNEKTSTGRAELKVEGGTGNYSISWDNQETGIAASALAAGPHTVTVTDGNGCSTVVGFETAVRVLPELTADRLNSGETVRMEKLQFAPDSSGIEASSIPTLNELLEFLEDNPTIVIEIGGHTNGIPSHEFCDKLSGERAKSVADYLTQKGINEKRIVYKGYGKRKPVATNATPEGRLKNQRVEIKILRLEGD